MIRKFPSLSIEKIKACILDSPQVSILTVWNSCFEVNKNFQGNHISSNYDIVKNMLDYFKTLGCKNPSNCIISSHLDQFSGNLYCYKEQSERFHQGLKTMEERYEA